MSKGHEERMRVALRVAAEVLGIADDWHVEEVQIDGFEGFPEVEVDEDGVFSTHDLANYCRDLASEGE